MKAHEIKEISAYAINIPDNRHLPLRPDIVESLTESIDSIGLLQPICVEADENHDTFRLVAGRHRLEALKRLKWEMIPATILSGMEALDVEAAELAENLVRVSLTATQRSMHFARLMEIAEIKHKMKAGRIAGDDDNRPQIDDNSSGSRSAQAVAKETHRSPTAVDRDAKRVRNIAGIADVVGTSLDVGIELDALAKLSADVQSELIRRASEGEKVSARSELKRQERAEKERALGAKQKELPTGKYSVIYADPPWSFKTFSETGKDKSAEMHYPTMTIEDIYDLPVGDIAENNSVLFMWATAPMLPEAIQTMKVWGFTYKSQMIWVKDRIATGYWFRNQHEILLVGTRGQVIAPAPGSQFPSVITAPVTTHSKKPEEFYRVIENYFPSVTKVELFARNGREGWSAWGNQAPENAQVDEDEWDAPAPEEAEEQGQSEFDDIFGDD